MKGLLMAMIMIGGCYAATNNIINEIIDLEINRASQEYQVEKALIRAIIKQESKFRPYSVAYESHLPKAEWYLRNIPEIYKENKLSYCSFGLMQVLFGTATWLGYQGTPEGLQSIEENIKYGCKYLRWLIAKYYNLHDVISAYNQGSPKKDVVYGGPDRYCNHAYVDAVYQNYLEYGGKK